MADIQITGDQAKTLGQLGKEHSVLSIETAGPLLAVRVYVQSASSSGDTIWYYNKKGRRVEV